jgi:hypothetical protein
MNFISSCQQQRKNRHRNNNQKRTSATSANLNIKISTKPKMAVYSIDLKNDAEYLDHHDEQEAQIQAQKLATRQTLFRTTQDGEWENPFSVSNKEGWVRQTRVEEDVSPSYPMDLSFHFGANGFENPFLTPNRVEWVREAEIEDEISPSNNLIEEEESLHDFFASWDRDFVDPESYFSDDSDTDVEYVTSVHVSVDELDSLYSELSAPNTWILGDDEEFATESGTSIAESDEFMSPIGNPFADDSYPFKTINELESVVSELESLINDQISANAFLDMDVDALITDVQHLNWQLVDNDALRGAGHFNLRPHSFRSSCGCYHCIQNRFGLDQDEFHDSKFCPCANCFIVREKGKNADRVRAEEKADKAWAAKLLPRLQPKAATRKAEDDRMLDEEEDEENIVSMFDLVRRGLRTLSK